MLLLSKKRCAFSLLEVLVTIVIIVVLVGILIPVTRGIGNRAQKTRCVANLRVIGIAMGNYAAENNGEWSYPLDKREVSPRGTWFSGILMDDTGDWTGIGSLVPYIMDKRVFVCPTSHRMDIVLADGDYGSLRGRFPTDYVTRGFNQSYHPFPPEMTRLADMESRAVVSCSFGYAPYNARSYPFSRHEGVYPVLFADGSVRQFSFPPDSVSLSNPPNVWDNPNLQMRIWDFFDGKNENPF